MSSIRVDSFEAEYKMYSVKYTIHIKYEDNACGDEREAEAESDMVQDQRRSRATHR